MIAVFYTESISLVSLGLGGLFFLLSIAPYLAGVIAAVIGVLLLRLSLRAPRPGAQVE